MTRRERNLVYFLAGVVGIIMFFLILIPAHAHGDTIINNYYQVAPPSPAKQASTLTITSGISSDDLAAGIATAMAAGGHQFDFSTTDWQGSITGAWQLGGDEENNASFAVGKRWKESFMPNTLVHFTYTPNGSEDWVMVGGTFRF